MKSMVNLKIDGKNVQIEKGGTILSAAEKAGIHIPTLCFLKKVSPTGACRVCVVEIEGVEKPQTACNTPALEGMVVTTESEQLAVIRRQLVQLLLVNHPLDCPVCDAGGECDLQDVCYSLDVTRQPFGAEDVSHGVINNWPLIQEVPSRCILCEKCVKVCHEVVGASALVVREAGERAFIDTMDGKPLDCEFCGNCVAVCPTGTLLSKPFRFKARPWELTRIPTVCTYCGSNCRIEYNIKNGKVYRVTATDGIAPNDGTLCIGGSFGYGYIHSSLRLDKPLIRIGGETKSAEWSQALGVVAEAIGRIRSEAGADALAGLSSARLTNEENYLFQKFFRVAVGTNNIDSEARFGALRSLQTLDKALALRGASNRFDRIAQADAVLVFGSDVTAEAPLLDWQIETACRKRDGKLVVANMRQVKLTRYAETFLQYRPGSEVALANALGRIILEKGWADEIFLQRYVKNLPEMKSHLLAVDLEKAAAETGLSLDQLHAAAANLGEAGSVAIIFGGDISRSALAENKIAAIANLALVSGALHGDIGGLFPVDEKGNMQGLLDMGVYPEALPGHQEYESARPIFESAWGVKLPSGGLNALQILEGIEQGNIRFLYLAACNPLSAFPDSGRWRRALSRVEFLVVQDILASELTALANVVLPGAPPAEKSGSVTSLDSRVSSVNQALPALGRADGDIFNELFSRVSSRGGAAAGLVEVGAEIQSLTSLYTDICAPQPGGPCLKEPFSPQEKSLFYTPVDGTETEEGMQLLTGKILFHFGTTSTFAEGCLEVAPAGFIEMHPEDAQSLGFQDGSAVKVTSETGTARAKVKISPRLSPGLLFAPYHFADVNIQQVIPSARNRVAVKVEKG
jgi:formate dehydrogenase (NADP+) alpha subunit